MICPKCGKEIDVEDIDEPDILYHYTSQKGLLGILKDSKLWMTDILYLNDSSEFTYTLNLAKLELEKLKELLPPFKTIGGVMNLTSEDEINNKTHDTIRVIKKFFEIFSDIKEQKRIENYIFSLSRKKDDLSQWRSYCPQEGGFSIGFDYKRLVSLLDKNEGYVITKCIYDSEMKHAFIKSLFDPINNIELQKDFDKNKVSLDIVSKTMFYSSFIKDKSFVDEQEYRIINNGINVDKIINHREGKSMIIPYIDFSPVDDDKLPISKIIVGPTPHPKLSKLSIDSLLKLKGYDVKAEISEIPYRSW